MHARPLALLLCAALVPLAGCGSDDADAPASTANAIVDPDGDLPTVMELDRAPGAPEGELLLSTNKGLFRVSGGKAEPIRATVKVPDGTSAIGRTMAFTAFDEQTMIGGGHPESEELPVELGILRSEDGGASWSSVSRVGDADIHMFVARHDRLYAWDAVLGAVLVSKDGGKTFTEGITPPGQVLDMVVDPKDPDRIVIAGENAIFRSEDGAQTWRPLTSAREARLAWPENGPLIRADSDGSVHRSTDGGDQFDSVGSVEDLPQDFFADEAGTLHLALADGSIWRSSDEGATWEQEFKP